MQPFRQPDPPPPLPETDTSELQALVDRKRRGTRRLLIGIVAAVVVLPPMLFGALKGQEAWQIHRWRAGQAERDRLADERARAEEERERARQAEIAKHTFPLSSADHDRAAHALDDAERRAQQHAEAFARAWPGLVTHAVKPDRAGAKCPVEVPEPHLAGNGALDDLTNVDRSEQAAVTWVYVDGRGEPLAKELAKKAAAVIGRPADLDPVKGLVAISPPPVPSWPRGVARVVRTLRADIERPMVDTEHADFVRRAEIFAGDKSGGPHRYEFFAIVDVWFLPKESGPSKFDAGNVVAHSFVWDSSEDRAVCAGVAIAGSSRVVQGRTVDVLALHRDLRLQLERELASSMRAAVAAPAAR